MADIKQNHLFAITGNPPHFSMQPQGITLFYRLSGVTICLILDIAASLEAYLLAENSGILA